MTEDDYRTVNEAGWNRLAVSGCDSSQPYGPDHFVEAHRWLDGHGWLPWDRFTSVLCLAGGGGQQGPLFASLGYDVTVFDLSAEQLARDRAAAEEHGLSLSCVQGDMLDLSALRPQQFDLVYQPVSSLYVPDVRRCYREVARVLRPGGSYFVEHWNPVQMQLSETCLWDGDAYRLDQPSRPDAGTDWTSDASSGGATCRHYIHSMGDLVGGLCESGFAVVRFAERCHADRTALPGTVNHLAAYVPTFYAMLARRHPDPA